MPKRTTILASACAVLAVVGPAGAGPVEDLVTFTAGTPAKADEVNANFGAVAEAVNDNDARIAALEAEIAELRQQLTNALNIDPYLSLETVNGQPAIRISGANLQLVNALGETETANGTGNLLIGYDEERTDADPECSIGRQMTEDDCVQAGGAWGVSHKLGSHYLVVGSEHNYTRWGGIVVGFQNTSNFDFASVSGGNGNSASYLYASVSGGYDNIALGVGSSISGGVGNTASNNGASVSGGNNNTASGVTSSVSGGFSNSATNASSSVSGGLNNTAAGLSASVSGGASGTANGQNDWVAGSLFEDD
jgi:hypothetical protein